MKIQTVLCCMGLFLNELIGAREIADQVLTNYADPTVLNLPPNLVYNENKLIWKMCPSNYGIVGFQPTFNDDDNDGGVNGLTAYCGKPLVKGVNNSTIHYETGRAFHGSADGESLNCTAAGVAVGLRLRIKEGVVTDLEFRCMDVQTERIKFLSGKRHKEGDAIDATCDIPTDFVCGFQGVASSDDRVIAGIRIKCCTSPPTINHPHDKIGGKILSPTVPTNWGKWYDGEYCPPDSYVIGFSLKTEDELGTRFEDKNGLNGIKLICFLSRNGDEHLIEITSGEAPFGLYGPPEMCPGRGVAVGFKIQNQPPQGPIKDDKAATNFALLCSSSDSDWLNGTVASDGSLDGGWSIPYLCDENQIICGIQTQVETTSQSRNMFNKTDSVALNNIQVKCCDVHPAIMDAILAASKDKEIVIPTYNEVSGQLLVSKPTTNFGQWAQPEYCPLGTFVIGMELKIQSNQVDQEGLTGIRLFCSESNGTDTFHGKHSREESDLARITSGMTLSGTFGRSTFCKGVAIGFQLKVESYQGPYGDDTATNNLKLVCSDISNGEEYGLEGHGAQHGTWREEHQCPFMEVVCGIQTQVDLGYSTDKTGVNRVIMKCCNLEESTNLVYSHFDHILQAAEEHKIRAKTHEHTNGHILATPRILDQGLWFRGEYCPLQTRVVGFQLRKHHIYDEKSFRRNLISGVYLLCGNDSTSSYTISSGAIPVLGKLERRPKYCAGGSHVAGISIGLASDEFYIDEVDLHCVGGGKTASIGNGGTNYSIKIPPMMCKPGEFVCGIRTQLYFRNETMSRNGVKNINIKCCQDTSPAPQNSPIRHTKLQTKTETDGKILQAPHSIPVGNPASWKLCPNGSLANSFALKYSLTLNDLVGIRMTCADMNGIKTTLQVEVERQLAGKYGSEISCEAGAKPVGFQLRSTPLYGRSNGYTLEATDFRITCQEGFDVSVVSDQRTGNASLNNTGIWTGFQRCDYGQVLCGIMGYIDFTGETGAGLETIKMKCCDSFISTNSSVASIHENTRTHKGVFKYSKLPDPPVKNAEWSQVDYCSTGAYVIGYALKYNAHQRVTGLQLKCANPKEAHTKIEFIGRLDTSQGVYDLDDHDNQKCHPGAAIGFQLGFSSRRIQNLRLFCTRIHQTRNYTSGSRFPWKINEADEICYCPKGFAICGFQSLIDQLEGLLGVAMVCCKVLHPATVCDPDDDWEVIGSFDGTKASGISTYTYTTSTGISVATTSSDSLRREMSFAESMGYEFGISKSVEISDTSTAGIGQEDSSSNSETRERSKTVTDALMNSMSHSSSQEQSRSSSSTLDESTSKTRHSSTTFGSEMGFSSGGSVTAGASGGFLGFGQASVEATAHFGVTASTSSSSTSGTSDTVNIGRSNTESSSFSSSNSRTDGTERSHSQAETEGKGTSMSESHSSSNTWSKSKGLNSNSGSTRSSNKGSNVGSTTAYDWSRSETQTWQEEKTHSASLQVPPGYATTLYQAVGHCSFYTIKAFRVRRDDRDKYGNAPINGLEGQLINNNQCKK